MKLKKLLYPLVMAIAATLATTGCKHKPIGVTPIPGPEQPIVGNQGANPNTLPPGEALGGMGENPSGVSSTGSGSSDGTPTAPLAMFEGMVKDKAALAAYTIHFAFDSSVIRDSDQANISAVAAALNANPSDKVLIAGNCDERGTEEYNRALGERRALAARQALINAGISADRIRTISYGKDRPVDPAHTPAAWAKNRRDDFVLLHPPQATM